MRRFIYLTLVIIGLTASYAEAVPLALQQVVQVHFESKVGPNDFEWNIKQIKN